MVAKSNPHRFREDCTVSPSAERWWRFTLTVRRFLSLLKPEEIKKSYCFPCCSSSHHWKSLRGHHHKRRGSIFFLYDDWVEALWGYLPKIINGPSAHLDRSQARAWRQIRLILDRAGLLQSSVPGMTIFFSTTKPVSELEWNACRVWVWNAAAQE